MLLIHTYVYMTVYNFIVWECLNTNAHTYAATFTSQMPIEGSLVTALKYSGPPRTGP